MTHKRKMILVAGAATAALAAGGAAIAGAASGDDDGEGAPVTGPALERASRVALDRAGSGRVTASEIRDEEGYYKIEVTRPDGGQVDVHLDRRFGVIDATSDGR